MGLTQWACGAIAARRVMLFSARPRASGDPDHWMRDAKKLDSRFRGNERKV